MKRFLITSLAVATLFTGALVLPGCNGARDNAANAVGTTGERGFTVRTLKRGDRERKYGLFVPTNYNPRGRPYPVIVFLHGIGEGGSDGTKNLHVGLAPFVADRMSDFPFICIFPQSASGSWDENSDAATDMIACIDEVSKNYAIDQDRISLTGLSTGGYGTWAIGAKYKTRFAALVPMGSNASAQKYAGDLVDMPIRAYCNGSDMFGAFGGNDRGMVESIKALGGNKAEFTQTNDSGHDCWDGVYSSGELFVWLQQQRRKGAPAVPVSTKATSSIAPVSTPAVSTPAVRAVSAPAVSTPAVRAVTPAAATPAVRANSSAMVPTPY